MVITFKLILHCFLFLVFFLNQHFARNRHAADLQPYFLIGQYYNFFFFDKRAHKGEQFGKYTTFVSSFLKLNVPTARLDVCFNKTKLNGIENAAMPIQ